ncbi:hypothetical protein MAHJHV57_17060 [Mycobacterium avium subsp. hominissuis]
MAANRALVQALAATNWLGQNTPAIADIEAAYEQMWASDVAAMFGYHADASAAVAKLPPWNEVLQNLGFSNASTAVTRPAGSGAVARGYTSRIAGFLAPRAPQ